MKLMKALEWYSSSFRVVEGKIEIQLGETSYALGQGDCLAMQLDQPVIYSNHSAQVARYILVVSNQLVPALKESL